MKSLVQFIHESLITESFGSKIISNVFDLVKKHRNNEAFDQLFHAYQWDKITDKDIRETDYADLFDNKRDTEKIIHEILNERVILVYLNAKDGNACGVITSDTVYKCVYWDKEAVATAIDKLDYIKVINSIKELSLPYPPDDDSPVYIVDVTGLTTDDIHDKRAELKKGIQTAKSMVKDFNRKLRALKLSKRSSSTSSKSEEITTEQVKDLVIRYSKAIAEFDKIKNKIYSNPDLLTDSIHLMFELTEYNENVSSMDNTEAYNKLSVLCDKMEKLINGYK